MTLSQLSNYKAEIKPEKKLGQNFLMDANICAEIVAAADVRGGHVVEIGPGTGNLTRTILNSGARSITAIEFDRGCFESLQGLLAQHSNLTVINADALTFDETSLGVGINVVSNLPYNIGTVLLIKWLKNISLFSKITIMLQGEVVNRIVAKPGDSNYGFLSVISQFRCYVEKLFEVPPTAFWPVPKVTSAVVQFIPQAPAIQCSFQDLEIVLKAAFSQRRKMLRNSLKNLVGDRLQELLMRIEVKETARAEELSVEKFCMLTNLIFGNQNLNSR